ncbi:MAG: hypothetical protein EHM57_02975 [Actinobacteria bacterium]|nr:MAG: hypothetical protein EHM57_02975 [Actinomycetota bacterium]
MRRQVAFWAAVMALLVVSGPPSVPFIAAGLVLELARADARPRRLRAMALVAALALASLVGLPAAWLAHVGGEPGAAAATKAPPPVTSAAGLVRSHLASGPQRRGELIAAIEAAGYPREVWEGVASWIDLVRVPPYGTWERRRADLYGLADTWLPPADATEDDGMQHLLARYLRAFGPASLGDAADWSGVPANALRPVAERMRLRSFRDEAGGELIDLPRAPLPDPDSQAPVRFLPTWDATLLVHARRTRILPEEYRSAIFHTKNPHSVGTFLVDGSVAGTWRLEGGRIVTEPLHPLPAATRRLVAEEAALLAAFHAG